MIWILAYAAVSAGFFLVGIGIKLHWFWNAVFSLFASGSVIYTGQKAIRARFCPRTVLKAIEAGKDNFDIRVVIEAAFGQMPTEGCPVEYGTGWLSYVPLVIVGYVLSGYWLQSVIWRLIIAAVIATPIAVLLSNVAGRLIDKKRMMDSVETIITKHRPEAWATWSMLWRIRSQPPAGQTSVRGTSGAEKARTTGGRPEIDPETSKCTADAIAQFLAAVRNIYVSHGDIGDAKQNMAEALSKRIHCDKCGHRFIMEEGQNPPVGKSMTFTCPQCRAAVFRVRLG